MRAVGAGHAWSDVALTDGYLVEPDGLGGLSPDDGRCARGAERRSCASLGGTRMRDLNARARRATGSR